MILHFRRKSICWRCWQTVFSSEFFPLLPNTYRFEWISVRVGVCKKVLRTMQDNSEAKIHPLHPLKIATMWMSILFKFFLMLRSSWEWNLQQQNTQHVMLEMFTLPTMIFVTCGWKKSECRWIFILGNFLSHFPLHVHVKWVKVISFVQQGMLIHTLANIYIVFWCAMWIVQKLWQLNEMCKSSLWTIFDGAFHFLSNVVISLYL